MGDHDDDAARARAPTGWPASAPARPRRRGSSSARRARPGRDRRRARGRARCAAAGRPRAPRRPRRSASRSRPAGAGSGRARRRPSRRRGRPRHRARDRSGRCSRRPCRRRARRPAAGSRCGARAPPASHWSSAAPSSRTLPRTGRQTPTSTRASEDLPEALGPIMPSPLPALSAKATSCTTRRCAPGGDGAHALDRQARARRGQRQGFAALRQAPPAARRDASSSGAPRRSRASWRSRARPGRARAR